MDYKNQGAEKRSNSKERVILYSLTQLIVLGLVIWLVLEIGGIMGCPQRCQLLTIGLVTISGLMYIASGHKRVCRRVKQATALKKIKKEYKENVSRIIES